MNLLNLFWSDLIGMAFICGLVETAVTGKFITHGKAGRLVVPVKSQALRIVCFFAAVGLAAWVIIDSRHKLHSLMEKL